MTRRLVPLILIAFSLLVAGSVTWASPDNTPAPLDPAEPSEPVAVQALSVTLSASKDTYVNSTMPTTNYGNATEVWIGRTSSGTISQTLIYFDVSSVPGGAKVLSATLRLCDMINMMAAQAEPNLPQAATDLWAEAITGTWSETGVTWNTKPGSIALGDPPTTHGFDYTTWNVTNIVQRWISGTLTNNGFLLRPDAAMTTRYWFWSRSGTAICPPQLKIFYSVPVTGVVIGGPTSGLVGNTYNFTATVSPSHATTPITYTWSPAPKSGQGTRYAAYDWGGRFATGGLKTFTVTAQNESGSAVDTYTFNLIMPLTSVSISGPASGLTNTTYAFSARVAPIGATAPITYTWSPAPDSGQSTSSANYSWNTVGSKSITVTAQNPGSTVTDTHVITISAAVIPVSSVSLSGPTTGITGTDYAFMATLSPTLATVPFTFTWQTTDFANEVLTGTSTQSSIDRNWNTIGVKTITVTAANSGGSAQATRAITLTACRVSLSNVSLTGPIIGATNTSHAFTATVSPSNPTTPITYTWQATGQSQVVQSGTFTRTATPFTWNSTGTKAITVTAQNCGSLVTTTQTVNVVAGAQLPDLNISVWQEGANVSYYTANNGPTTVPAGHAVAMYIDGVLQSRVTINTSLAQYQSAYGYFPTQWQCAATNGVIRVVADVDNIIAESNETNNAYQSTWSCDTTYPQFVSGPTASSVTEYSALISWETDEPTRNTVSYGRTSGDYEVSISEPAVYTLQHSTTLSSLQASTTYHYKVVSTDASGHQVHSEDKFFTTAAPGTSPVEVTSLTLLPYYDSTFYEFYILRAMMQYTTNVSFVKLYFDDTYLGTDYTGSPQYEIYLSPYALGLTRDQFFAPHTLKVRAYNLNGLSTLFTQTVTPTRPTDPADVDILDPHPNHTIWIPSGTTAPAGTTLDVTARAAAYEWGCTWTGFSEGDEVPSGLTSVLCKNVDHAAQKIELFLDNTLVGTFTPPNADAITHTFSLNLTGKSVGAHTLKAKATVNGGTLETTRDFTIEAGQPSLTVQRYVTRYLNHLTVRLTLVNEGIGDAQVDKIKDGVTGLQQVNQDTISYTMSTDASYWLGDSRKSVFWIDLKSGSNSYITIPPGGSASVEYVVMPVLFESAVMPTIGGAKVQVYLQNGQIKEFDRPVSMVYDKSAGYDVPLAQAVADAVQRANYVIVTNPNRLTNFYSDTAGIYKLYSTMAKLAYVKQGVLGLLKTYCFETLDTLLETTWADQLDPDFKSENGTPTGYVLLVGETEIIPAWYENSFNIEWSDGSKTKDVSDSDLPYASLRGKDKHPEVALGRIIGNSPAALIKPIETSIAVWEGYSGYRFDRSNALLVSGRGVGVTSDFIPTVNIIEDVLQDDGTAVTKIHWYNYDASSYTNVFTNATPNQDIVYFFGHGNVGVWGPGLNTSMAGVWPLNFNGSNPFVYGTTCLSGGYEPDANSMPEKFLDSGAGAYVGATQVSANSANASAGKWFFRNWGRYEPTGSVLTRLKQGFVSDSALWRLWSYEYNLYGDPKYGAIRPGLASQTEPSLTATPAAAQAPSPTLTVTIPNFTVVPADGWDYVEIPGGDALLAQDEYPIPYWTVSVDYPAGLRAQAVKLTSRSGLVITTGLHLTVTQITTSSLGVAGAQASTPPPGWYPAHEQQYTWMVGDNGDGTSKLRIKLYPFYYDSETTTVLFYRDYALDIQTIAVTAQIDSLVVDKPAYRQGEPVSIDLRVSNPGAAQDVVVGASIKSVFSDTVVTGLPLRLLSGLTGTAQLAFQWDTVGVTPGRYYVEVELRDGEGQMLETEVTEFQLGVLEGHVASLTATPTVFEPGQSVNVSMVFSNTGSLPITGTAYIQVQISPTLDVITTFSHAISNLAPGAAVTLNDVWNSTGAALGPYRILGYVVYGGQTSDPQAVMVNTRYRVYLPLVIR